MAAYKTPEVPANLFENLPLQVANFTGPGQIQGQGSWLAKLLGTVPSVPVSKEAWKEMTPEQVGAVSTEAGRAGNWNILKLLAGLVSIVAPELIMLASGAGQEAGMAEARARGEVGGAEERYFKNLTEQRLGQIEGLQPTPTSAVTGYMPMGVARGMQATADMLRGQAAQSKSTEDELKLQAEAVKAIRGGIKTRQEWETVKAYFGSQMASNWQTSMFMPPAKMLSTIFPAAYQRFEVGTGPEPPKKSQRPSRFSKPITSPTGKQGWQDPKTGEVWVD